MKRGGKGGKHKWKCERKTRGGKLYQQKKKRLSGEKNVELRTRNNGFKFDQFKSQKTINCTTDFANRVMDEREGKKEQSSGECKYDRHAK